MIYLKIDLSIIYLEPSSMWTYNLEVATYLNSKNFRTNELRLKLAFDSYLKRKNITCECYNSNVLLEFCLHEQYLKTSIGCAKTYFASIG